MIAETETLKPQLKTPFPDVPEIWTCPKTGLKVPKDPVKNILWREKLLRAAEHDPILQRDLLAACGESQLFWVNTFVWTYHQWDTDPETGKRYDAKNTHHPFITWTIQNELFNAFEKHLKNGEDILIDKSREMGASWMCVCYLHWLWLFRPERQL